MKRAGLLLACCTLLISPGLAQQKDAAACALSQPEAMLPLHTQGSFIVDSAGRRIKLSGVAWYGAESRDFAVGGLQHQPLETIAHRIRCMGFTAVRLPWSNEMVETNPLVPAYALQANPALQGSHALDLYDRVVRALAAEGLYIVLDNHNSDAMWCCSKDGNDLWYTARYPEPRWIADWKFMAARYRKIPQVIAADIRNEPRERATWGGDPATDWHAAAERGGNAVLSVNPSLLIMVEGINYSLNLRGVASLPIHLRTPNRLVYSPHDYPFDHKHFKNSGDLAAALDAAWGYIAAGTEPYTAPIWLGEFGNWNNSAATISDSAPGSSGLWFASLREYLALKDLDWSWWGLNGSESTGATRTYDQEEGFGIVNRLWSAPSLPQGDPAATGSVLAALQPLMQPSQGSGVEERPAPLITISLPQAGAALAHSQPILLRAEAGLRRGSPDTLTAVEFLCDGKPVGRSTSPPYTVLWKSPEAGMHHLQARAITANHRTALSEEIPITITAAQAKP